MSGADLLQYSTSASIDPFFRKAKITSGADSVFTPVGWRTFTNFAIRRRAIVPINGVPSYGGQSMFKEDKSVWQRGPHQLQIVRSALAVQGNGTFSRFVDYEGYEMINYIQVFYGANLLFQVYGDWLMIEHKLNESWRNAKMTETLLFGEKTQTERNKLASAQQTLYVDLPLPFCKTPGLFFFSVLIATELQINVFWKPLASITQTNATNTAPTGTILSVNMITTDFHVMGDERQVGSQLALSQEGITYRILDWENQSFQLTSGQPTYAVQLTNIKGAMVEVIMILRKLSALTTTLPSVGQTYNDYQQIANWTITTGGVILVDQIDDVYSRFYIDPLYHSNLMGSYIYMWSFSMEPESMINATGHKTAAAMTAPTLTITLPATLAVNAQLDVYTRTNNLWSLNGGEIKRVFN